MQREQVFMYSYSHENREWLETLQTIPKSGLSSAKNKIPRFWPKPEGICGMIATSCLLPASCFS